jgi:hypothetical protein
LTLLYLSFWAVVCLTQEFNSLLPLFRYQIH